MRCIHHCTNVVHALLDGRRTIRGIRQPCAALVEEDQSRKRCEALAETAFEGVVPPEL